MLFSDLADRLVLTTFDSKYIIHESFIDNLWAQRSDKVHICKSTMTMSGRKERAAQQVIHWEKDTRLLTSVNKKNLSNFSFASFLFSLFYLLPPRLVRHLVPGRRTEWMAVNSRNIILKPEHITIDLKVKLDDWSLIILHLGTSSNPVDLWERAVKGVKEVQSTAGCPHPALVPCLGDETQPDAPVLVRFNFTYLYSGTNCH